MHDRAHRLGVAAITLALVTLVGVAYAQTSSTSSTSSTTSSSWTTSAVTGTVMSVDPQAKTVTIKSDAGSQATFMLSDPIWMRSAGKDLSISELKVGDRVRIEPTPGASTDAPTRTASRLEVLGTGSVQGSAGSTYGAESPSMGTSTQPGSGSPQRTVSTERPVLGEPADAGEDRQAMPSSAGSTTGRPVSTDRPVLGQSPTGSTSSSTSTTGTTGTTGSSTYGTTGTTGTATGSSTTGTGTTGSSTYGTTGTTGTATGSGSSTYGSSTTTPSPSPGSSYGASRTTSSTSTQTSADELPATASPLPMLGVLGLLALVAGFAVRATRKQLS